MSCAPYAVSWRRYVLWCGGLRASSWHCTGVGRSFFVGTLLRQSPYFYDANILVLRSRTPESEDAGEISSEQHVEISSERLRDGEGGEYAPRPWRPDPMARTWGVRVSCFHLGFRWYRLQQRRARARQSISRVDQMFSGSSDAREAATWGAQYARPACTFRCAAKFCDVYEG